MAVDVNTVDQEIRDALVAVLGEEALEPATQEAIQAQVDQISAMMETWKNRDVAGFEKIYNKEAILESDDELNSKLFTDRDPGMIQYAADYLSQEGSHTGLMVVGAGHMVGDTGIVQGLIDQGYTVEVHRHRPGPHRPGLYRGGRPQPLRSPIHPIPGRKAGDFLTTG